MERYGSRWRTIPVPVYVGVALGGSFGAFIGNALCIGYDIWNGPFLPQAGVDPQPAGWVGWWTAGGAVVGAAVGLVASVLLVAGWRLLSGRGRTPHPS